MICAKLIPAAGPANSRPESADLESVWVVYYFTQRAAVRRGGAPTADRLSRLDWP
jgi:hypothetical protein